MATSNVGGETQYFNSQPNINPTFRFMDNGDFSPLGNDWSAKEFVKLLDGLEQFGYGNWNDVSRYKDQSLETTLS